MIFYSIQHHGDVSGLSGLIELVTDDSISVEIRFDGPQDTLLEVCKSLAVFRSKFRHFSICPSRPIFWCGPSQAFGIIDAMRSALCFPEWQVWINLSGNCTPIKSQKIIQARLAPIIKGEIDACLSYFQVKRPYELPVSFTCGIEMRGEFGRLKIIAQEELLKQFNRTDYFPLKNATNRPFLRCAEVSSHEKILRVWCPDGSEIEFRKEYFLGHIHYCGRAWYALSRSAVEKIVEHFDSEKSMVWRSIFFNSFQPDESFLQTAILSHQVLKSERVINENFRFHQGAPMQIDNENIDTILCSDALFARKLPMVGRDEIMRKIQRVIFE